MISEDCCLSTEAQALADSGYFHRHHRWALHEAMKTGTLCGRLPGAGCGFLLFCAEPDRQPAAGKALSELMLLPFGFEYGGNRIIYYRAKEYVRDEDRYDLHVAFNHPLTLSSHVLNSILLHPLFLSLPAADSRSVLPGRLRYSGILANL